MYQIQKRLKGKTLPDYIPLFEIIALVYSVLAQAQEFQRALLLLHVVLQNKTNVMSIFIVYPLNKVHHLLNSCYIKIKSDLFGLF